MEEVSREGAGDTKFIKMDDAPFRYMIEKSDETKLLASGWEFDTEPEWAGGVDRVHQHGAQPEAGSDTEAAQRCVTKFHTASDPAGNVFELYFGRTETGTPYTPQLDVKGFETGDMGLGHIVLPAPNQDEVHAFYTKILGFRDSDDLKLPPPAPGAPDQRIRFLHANNPRHHSLGLYNFPMPTGCVHVMAEVGSLDEVGSALDRVTKAGVPLLASLGRHENDEMVSFYAIGPGGIAVEFGYDGKQIDPENYTATESTRGDFWGHDYQMPGADA